jgi:3-oxoacyl-[acyl-carrier protein] reductase
VLCNNAAIFGADVAMFNPIAWDPVAGPIEQYRKVMSVNVDSIVYCSRAVIPVMKAQGFGRIINTSSGGVYFDIGNLYSLSKLAVNGVTRMFARAVGKDGITVNAIAPGITVTEAHYNRYASIEEAETTLQAFAEKEVPIPRPGRPADIFHVVRFLASDDADYVTGHTLSIDGGWFNRV